MSTYEARSADTTSVEAAPRGRDLSYHPELDGIRAFAILAVMIFHVAPYMGGYNYRGGFLGVDVFFVLSGYLITTLLLRERDSRQRIHLRAFYMRRALRLAPALLLTLVLGAFVVKTLATPVGARPYWKSALFALFYVGNWAEVRGDLGVLAHTWSLAIEEQYYLLWPATLIVFARFISSRRGLALLVAGGAVGVAVLRLVVFESGQHLAAALWTPTRADGVLLGSALAIGLADPPLWLSRILRRREVAFLCAGALLVASLFVYWDLAGLYQGGLLALNLCATGLIGHLVLRPEGFATRVFSRQPLPAIGRISYGLYVYHIPVNYLVFGHPRRWTGLAAVGSAIALSFAVAAVSFWFIERPILGLKRRFGSMSQMPRVIAAA